MVPDLHEDVVRREHPRDSALFGFGVEGFVFRVSGFGFIECSELRS